MWKNYKLEFILINLFIFCSFSFFIISYDSASYEEANCSMETYYYNTYTFEFEKGTNIPDKIDEIDKLIKQEKNIRCVFFSYDNAINKVLNDKNGMKEDYSEKICIIYYGEIAEGPKVNLGRWFSEEEMENGAKYIVIPDKFYIKANMPKNTNLSNFELGSTFEVNNEEYIIIGTSRFLGYYYYMPYNSFTDKIQLASEIKITIKELYGWGESDRFVNRVNKALGSTLLEESNKRATGLDIIFGCAFFILLNLTVINLVSLYSYLINTRKKMIGLFKMYGMGKNRSGLYLTLEFYAYVVANFILSCIFSNIYIFIQIQKHSERFSKGFRYLSLKEYLIFFVAFSIIYLLIFFPTIYVFVAESDEISLLNEEYNS